MSLLLLFGGGPTTQAGVRSLLAFWIGGAGVDDGAAPTYAFPVIRGAGRTFFARAAVIQGVGR